MINYINLFEYTNVDIPEKLKSDIKNFKQFLNDVWKKYKELYKEERPPYWRDLLQEETDEDKIYKQPFLSFDDDTFKSKNYIGFIKYNDFCFNLYPKICPPVYDNEGNLKNKEKINNMLLLWLQYSKRTIFPNTKANLNEYKDFDFIDILIFFFAKYTSDLLSVSIYQHYEEISEETNFLKGKLNFTEYIKNCAKGKSHKFHCTYDSFEINNKFNQIIKYVSKCLYEITDKKENKNYLEDIISSLDEVEDKICTYNDCESVYINRFLGEFQIILDYCKLFLSHSVTFNESGDFNNFAFLIRTELLFEDFISNLGAELQTKEIKIIPQRVIQLDKEGHFSFKPDLIINNSKGINKIIDIKYKDIKCKSNTDYDDVKQADIYQCFTYAVKLNYDNITLLYPNFGQNKNLNPIEINGKTINFKFIDCYPEDDIDSTKEKIKDQLSDII